MRSRWWLTFVVLLGLIEAWSLAMPLFGAPDEPGHVVKAAATAHGDLIGEDANNGAWRSMRAPADYVNATDVPACFAFRSDQDASCSPNFHGRPGNELITTSAGTYPPLYYIIVGAPSLLVSGEASVYLMRLFSAAAVAALTASALLSTALLTRPLPGMLAVAGTVTPMLLFIGGSVNPSALEIAAGIGVWASGLTLLSRPDHPQIRRVIWRFTVASCALILTRVLSPAIYALILVFLLAYANPGTLRRIVKMRSAQWGVVVIAFATLLATLWIVGVYGHLGYKGELVSGLTGLPRAVLGRQDFNFKQMIGIFGWLDTRAPALTYHIWIVLIGLFVCLTWAVGTTRRRWLVLLGGVLSVAVPWALEVEQAPSIGIFWQGRYTMPFAAGVLIMAGFVIAESEQGSAMLQRVVRPIATALVIGVLLAYLQYCRRFAVGLAGPLVFVGESRWDPFLLPWPALVPLSVFFTVTAGVALARAPAVGDHPSDPESGRRTI